MLMSASVSCEKLDLETDFEECDGTEETLEIPDGEQIEIDGSEYFKYKIPATIHKIVITDGNGTIHVDKGRETQISIPGYWVKPAGHNYFEITENTITINNTFTDSYLTLSDLSGVEIVDGNSKTFLNKSFATGKVAFEISGNSTVTLGQEGEEVEVVEALDFKPEINIYNNGTYDGYGVKVSEVKAKIHENGHVHVIVEDHFDIDIETNGTAYYKGYPTIVSVLSFQASLIDEN